MDRRIDGAASELYRWEREVKAWSGGDERKIYGGSADLA